MLAVPAVGWADIPWGAGGIVGALEECEAELASCQEQPGSTFPGDGWPDDEVVPGGAPLSYTDNGDGTFTDDNTGLMWEIKAYDGTIHDVDNTYTWSATGVDPDGTAFTVFRAGLNDQENPFAGHTSWRLPTAKELQSLVDYSVYGPAVSDELPGATAPYYYWSSTANANNDDNAWNVNFRNGYVVFSSKGFDFHVRAVRGGR